MELLILSSLEKVFADERPSAPECKSFSMLKNERSSFQVAFCCENDGEITAEISGNLAEKSKIYFEGSKLESELAPSGFYVGVYR